MLLIYIIVHIGLYKQFTYFFNYNRFRWCFKTRDTYSAYITYRRTDWMFWSSEIMNNHNWELCFKFKVAARGASPTFNNKRSHDSTPPTIAENFPIHLLSIALRPVRIWKMSDVGWVTGGDQDLEIVQQIDSGAVGYVHEVPSISYFRSLSNSRFEIEKPER